MSGRHKGGPAARGAAKAGAKRRVRLPPPLPSAEDLEQIAAASAPTVEGAWWITAQVVEHILTRATDRDPRTGAPLPQSLLAYLERLDIASSEGRRPLPCDRLACAAELAERPLAEIIDRHRTRLERTHEQLPFHRLRDVDPRSVAWMARLPGRTVREKLAGHTHALGVLRRITADTPENRAARAVGKLLAQRLGARLAYGAAYDRTADSTERAARFNAVLSLCGERLRRSALGEIPVATRVRPNNVLLSDPAYSKIYRVWRWLRDDEAELHAAWRSLPERATVALFFLVTARLVRCAEVLFWDSPGRLSLGVEGGPFGLLQVSERSGTRVWSEDASFEFLVTPEGLRDTRVLLCLSAQQNLLVAHLVPLKGEGLQERGAVEPVVIELQLAPEPLAPGRGIAIAADGCDDIGVGAPRSWGDLDGLCHVADAIAATLLTKCGSRPRRVAQRPSRSIAVSASAAHIGVAFHASSIGIDAGGGRVHKKDGWVAACQLADGEGFEWLPGRPDRRLRLGTPAHRIYSMGDALDVEGEDDGGTLALATSRIVEEVASELDASPTARIAYAVPDAIDEFSQRSLRAAMTSRFRGSLPVWRSVCAAVAWQATEAFRGCGVGAGDHVVVVDTEFGRTTLTLLVARHDPKLEAEFPSTGGLYWERKPPLPPDEDLEMLGWQTLLERYAENRISASLNNKPEALSAIERRSLAEDLVRVGVPDGLLGAVRSRTVRTHSSAEGEDLLLRVAHNPSQFDGMVGNWVKSLADAVEATSPLVRAPRGSSTHMLFVGDAFTLPDARERAKRMLDARLRRARLPVPAFVGPEMIATGARQAVVRLERGCRVWMEWLPDLSLEVIRDGHFGELHLLDKDTVVDPFLGEARAFIVDEPLTLGRGQAAFSFPLLMGRGGTRPLAWEARVESSAFPLAEDFRVSLRLEYRYGLDASYHLSLEPDAGLRAPFGRLQARWVTTADRGPRGTTGEVPSARLLAWTDEDVCRFVEAAGQVYRGVHDERFGRYLYRVTRACWSSGRSLAGAPSAVVAAYGAFVSEMQKDISDQDISPENVPRALELLCLLHEDAPAEVNALVLRLDDVASDEFVTAKNARGEERRIPRCRSTLRLLRDLVGSGAGRQRPILDRLVDRLQRHTAFETFNPQLANETLSALRDALWRDPRTVGSIQQNGGAQLLVEQARRTLNNLLTRVPTKGENFDEQGRERVSRLYWRPYREACEILVALLGLRETSVGAPLRQGAPSADAIAKAVRQLDARFARCGVGRRWLLTLDVTVPESLHRMSTVAFALNAYLTGTWEANLVEVTATDFVEP